MLPFGKGAESRLTGSSYTGDGGEKRAGSAAVCPASSGLLV